jgi:fused signal recognition particle receptor
LWERVEEVLLSADVGVDATLYLVDRLRKRTREEGIRSADEILSALEEEITAILSLPEEEVQKETKPPLVVLVVGVNGVGKTTTIAKIAHQLIKAGKKVLLVAADTFRAAAIEQLETWAERLGTDVIKHQRRADPAAVVFDAIKAAQSRGTDVVLVDTAGRLHTHVNLMEELKKIRRVAEKAAPESRTETLLVIDASTGQNALSQAKLFKEALGIEGIILTKLDGTAKGGIVIAIANDLKIPIRLVGTGEGLDDLQEFYAQDFAEALLKG